MPLPPSITLVPVHVKVIHADAAGTPAIGKIYFAMPYTLRDSGNAVLLGRTTFTATLDAAGEATVSLPPTDDADISPSGWQYTVTPATDAWHDGPFLLTVPAATVGTLELAAHAPASTPTTVATYALLGHTHVAGGGTVTSVTAANATIVIGGTATDPTVAVGTIAQGAVSGLTAALAGKEASGTAAAAVVTHEGAGDPHPQYATDTTLTDGLATKQPLDADLTAIAALTPANDDLLQRKGGVWTFRTPAQVKADLALRVVIRDAYITSGNVSPVPDTGGLWKYPGDVGGLPTDFQLLIPAAIGDWVELGIDALKGDTTTIFVDAAVKVSSSVVRHLSSGTATPAVEGDPGWYPAPFNPISSPRGFVVEAGHLDGSNVRFVLANKTAGAGVLYASTSFPFYWVARNLGPVA